MQNKLTFATQSDCAFPQFAVVGLHGWQGDHRSMQITARSLKLDKAQWYFPDAPYLVEDDPARRSWSREVEPGKWEMDIPLRLLHQFFTDEIFSLFDSQDVFVIGFSQGALACFEIVLKLDQPLGAVFPVAGFLRYPDAEGPLFHPAQKNTPILIGHGINDDVVPVAASRMARDKLKAQGANVQLMEFNGKHKIGVSYLREVQRIIHGEEIISWQ